MAWRRRPPVSIALAYSASHASNYAAGLAFNAFVLLFPLMLGLVALLGLLQPSGDIRASVEQVLVVAFPPSEQAGMLRSFQHERTSAGALALFSLVALLWSGTSLFTSMEFALDQIFGCPTRSFWRARLRGLAMLGVFLVAIGAAVAVTSAIASAPERSVLAIASGWLLVTAMLVAVYRFVPNRHASFSDVWPGAVVAGLAIELLNFAFPAYIHFTGGVRGYGQSFGFLFVLGAWTYLLSQALLLGAVINRMRADRVRSS